MIKSKLVAIGLALILFLTLVANVAQAMPREM